MCHERSLACAGENACAVNEGVLSFGRLLNVAAEFPCYDCFSMTSLQQVTPAFLDTSTPAHDPELQALITLKQAGLRVAPVLIAPAEMEERFYRLNNLPEQLNALFKHLDLRDPDEDDIEELAPRAIALLKTHYLLDETIDLFYESLTPLPSRVRVRRPGEDGVSVLKGRPALIALKQLWADAWTFEALMTRLTRETSIALEARPVLIHSDNLVVASVTHNEQASRLLGRPVSLRQDDALGISRVIFL